MNKGPLLLIGDSLQSRWHDCANGDLLLDVEGEILHFRRNGPCDTFKFDHDAIHDGALYGSVTEVIRDGQGNFVSFRTGPVCWEVIGWSIGTDVYLCVPSHRAKRPAQVWLPPTAVKVN